MWFWLMKCNYQKRLLKAAWSTYAFSFELTSTINTSADIPRKNLTDYEMWLLPLWCYAVGPIHLTRPCKYCNNACEYHEVNNPVSDSTICQWLRWQVASKLLLRSSPLTSYHFGIHCTTVPTCFCFTLYIPLLQIRIIPAPVHSTLAPATKDGSSKEWWMIPINQLSSLFSERGFCEQMLPT